MPVSPAPDGKVDGTEEHRDAEHADDCATQGTADDGIYDVSHLLKCPKNSGKSPAALSDFWRESYKTGKFIPFCAGCE
jgi:hypothetical protein